VSDDLMKFMADSDDSLDAYVRLVRESPITTPWLARFIAVETKHLGEEQKVTVLATLLATAVQRLAGGNG
jgi:hypothetical protein